jgi:heme ABC exporter ATP-binding subunit CcmA
MASGDALRLRSAVALLGSFPALAGATLDVDRGEVILVQGPNGAGKTTLLRVCAGLLGVVAGEVVVLGHDLTRNRRAVRRYVGFLGAADGLYEDLSVSDNVRFAVRAAGGDPAAVAPALARLGLDGRLAQTAAARLSTGQRRRTAVAVLAARCPALWLLDEPHAGLDADGRDLLDDLIREAAAAGATIVFASHEQDRAVGLAGRTLTVAGGTVRPAGGLGGAGGAGGAGGTARGAGGAGGAGPHPALAGADPALTAGPDPTLPTDGASLESAHVA